MLLGHGAVSEHPIASIRGTGQVNVGSPFVSGSSFSVSLGDETVTGTASVSPSTNVSTFSIGTETVAADATFAVTTAGVPTFTIGTETVAASASVTTTTAGQMTFSIGDETAFGDSFQNLISLSTGSPELTIWSQTDDSQTVTWTNVEPGSTD